MSGERRAVTVVDCGSDKTGQLLRIISESGFEADRVPLCRANQHGFADSSAVVISGGPHLFTGLAGAKLVAQFAFLPRLDMPLLGICLGHQALGLASGAEVYLGSECREAESIQIRQPAHALFSGVASSAVFSEDHCEAITAPPGFAVIASSESCAVEAIADDSRQRYGVQFHPETSGVPGRRLIGNFLRNSSRPRLAEAPSTAEVREKVQLRFDQGQSISKIAKELGIAYDALRRAVSDGRLKLQKDAAKFFRQEWNWLLGEVHVVAAPFGRPDSARNPKRPKDAGY